MKIMIHVLSSNVEKAKLFSKYIMRNSYSEPISIRETKYELMIETESAICKVVRYSESYRGNKYHKLYVDSSSEINEELYYSVFHYRNVPFSLPNSMFRLEIENPVERINFSEFIQHRS